MKSKFAHNSQYQAVRQLIKQNWQPTLSEIQDIYKMFGFKELPYQIKSKRTGTVRYYDPCIGHGTRVHYVLNERNGEMRKRAYNYGGPVNPRPLPHRNKVTAPFVNNIPKQMLYVLSTMIAERLSSGGQIHTVFPPEVPRPEVFTAQTLTGARKQLTAQDFTNAMSNAAINDVFQLTPTRKSIDARVTNVKQVGKEVTLNITITLP
jgi:hypothetical protein